MALTVMRQELAPAFQGEIASRYQHLQTQSLTQQDRREVLHFLADRPIHTVFMASLITDNGFASSFNRGSFYGCRNSVGRLEGVALLGHATIIETGSTECIKAFARLAKNCSLTHLIRGEQEKVESFWSYYAESARAGRLLCRELLLQRKAPPTGFEPLRALRQATPADLEQIISVNASMVCQESGINPLKKDGAGFRERAARRIRQGRIWVLIENGQLIFKTDIIAETPKAAYVEGVYVNPEKRGQGYGLRCISQLTEYLLTRTRTVLLTVNEKFPGTLAFYQRAGFEVCSRYDTIYLQS
ncbi:MAG: GNAT family N-acetyltransferase [Pyrinomonadaceae bacterium]